jgi:diacylglycerol kinase (ATP)
LELERVVVLVNASAGSGRSGRLWEALRRRMPEVADARLILAKDAATARRELDEHLCGDVEAVFAWGGDGTAHLVVNRILEAGRGDEVAVGLLPAGTGSDLARCFGLPRRPEEALRQAEASGPRPIDVLEIRTESERRFVVNIASAGVSGAAGAAVNAMPRRGPTSYVMTALRVLLGYQPVPCRVTVDGVELYDGGFFLVVVANGRYFGHGVRVAPDAEVDDGLADVVLVPPIPLWHVPYRLPQVMTGRYVKLPFVLSRRGRCIRFEPRGELPPYDVDGETMAGGAATVRVLPGALRILS